MTKKQKETALPKAAKIGGELLAVAALALVLTTPLRGGKTLHYLSGSQQLARTTTTQVVSGDMSFGKKPAADENKVVKLVIETTDGASIDYLNMVWDRPTVRAIAHRANGTKSAVPAVWSFKRYGDKEPIDECSLTSDCTLSFKKISDYADIIAEFQGVTAIKGIKVIGTYQGYAVSEKTPAFTDEIPDWARQSIEDLARLGIMTGYDNGQFGPGDSMTKAQFATMLYRAIVFLRPSLKDTACTVPLPEKLQDHFAASAFCLASSRAWDLSWALEPDAPITRSAVAHMANESFGEDIFWEVFRYLGVDTNDFDEIATASDVADSHPHYRAVNTMIIFGIMGEKEKPFRPDDQLNRAEAATVLNRLIRKTVTQME